MDVKVDLDDRKSVIDGANRHATTAITAHRQAGRSTYSGDAEHTYERTSDGAAYLVEDAWHGLERVRLVRPAIRILPAL